MASKKLPGTLNPSHRPHAPIDLGTNGRNASPRPGVVGSDGTEALDLPQRVVAALQMVPAHLPAAAAQEFQELLSPTNLEIMAGSVVALVVAHAVGVGFVADGVALCVGAFFLGWQVGDLANHLIEFGRLCTSAQSRGDLDRAAVQMAQAVLIFGVAVVSFFLLRKGVRAREAAGSGVPPGVKLERVGRWMSAEELAAMRASGTVQQSRLGGTTNVLSPPDPTAYRASAPGSVYVEFDVPESSLAAKSLGQKQIPGPGSLHARLAASKGQPVPQMPKFYNLTTPLEKGK